MSQAGPRSRTTQLTTTEPEELYPNVHDPAPCDPEKATASYLSSRSACLPSRAEAAVVAAEASEGRVG